MGVAQAGVTSYASRLRLDSGQSLLTPAGAAGGISGGGGGVGGGGGGGGGGSVGGIGGGGSTSGSGVVTTTTRSGRVVGGRVRLGGELDEGEEGGEEEEEDEDEGMAETPRSSDGDETAASAQLKTAPERKVQFRPAQPTRHVFRTETQLCGAAESDEVLIPIRLDLDVEQYKIKDAFTWNMNEELITPDSFAQIMCTDLDIPAAVFASQISTSIRTQIEEYAPVAEIQLPEDHDLRVIINLSLHFSKELFKDTFEWDLTTSLTPEAFAAQLCADLGLAGEYYPAISHAIHETTLRLKKEACEGGLPAELDNDVVFGGDAGIRVDQEGSTYTWTPSIEILSREEIEKREGDRDRQLRRLRRETARFGASVLGERLMLDTTSAASRKAGSKRRSASPPSVRNGGSRGQSPTAGQPSAAADGDISVGSAFTLTDNERGRWHCQQCFIRGRSTPFVRRGPNGNKSLCNACGIYWVKHGFLPEYRRAMFAGEAQQRYY